MMFLLDYNRYPFAFVKQCYNVVISIRPNVVLIVEKPELLNKEGLRTVLGLPHVI